MNNPTRKTINEIMDKLAELKDSIDELQGEEQDKYDNLTDGLQCSERGEAIQNAADNLSYAVDSLYEVIDYLNEAIA